MGLKTNKIDKIERRILYELDRNARIPETQLAKIVKRSKESVRYRIKQLQKKGIIQGFSIWIDPVRLGYISKKIYFTLLNKPDMRKQFIEHVRNDKRVFWLGIADGVWNAGLTYFVKSNREFFDIKNELFTKFGDIITNSHTGSLVEVNSCGKKHFFLDKDTKWDVQFSESENIKLDSVEEKIIREIYLNARMNIVEIARNINSTTDIIRGRIKKLQDKKIICRYIAKIDYKKLSLELYKTFIYFRNLTKEDEAKFMEYTRKTPQIIHLVKQISPWDIELESVCENYHEYNLMLNNLTEEFSYIITKTETAIMNEDYVYPSRKLIFE